MEKKFQLQVNKDHYFTKKYFSQDRWANYWYQINILRGLRGQSILEIGIGNGLVADVLKKLGFSVKTVDIDPELKPDAVGSLASLPFADGSFAVVLAAEVLEHLSWNKVPQALSEVRRVSQRYILITLPHSGYTFSFICKIPLLPWCRWIFKIPHFWKIHVFNGEHYWELGKKGYSLLRLKKEFSRAGLKLIKAHRYADDPAHYFFLLEKYTTPTL